MPIRRKIPMDLWNDFRTIGYKYNKTPTNVYDNGKHLKEKTIKITTIYQHIINLNNFIITYFIFYRITWKIDHKLPEQRIKYIMLEAFRYALYLLMVSKRSITLSKKSSAS